ncbi:MAG: hypothetical protein AB1651_06720 [Pseudomonadota bacterium]
MDDFIPRAFVPGRDHFFLLGPRGTGKTSWCIERYPEALRIDLLDPALLRQLSARPEASWPSTCEHGAITRQAHTVFISGRPARKSRSTS